MWGRKEGTQCRTYFEYSVFKSNLTTYFQLIFNSGKVMWSKYFTSQNGLPGNSSISLNWQSRRNAKLLALPPTILPGDIWERLCLCSSDCLVSSLSYNFRQMFQSLNLNLSSLMPRETSSLHLKYLIARSNKMNSLKA